MADQTFSIYQIARRADLATDLAKRWEVDGVFEATDAKASGSRYPLRELEIARMLQPFADGEMHWIGFLADLFRHLIDGLLGSKYDDAVERARKGEQVYLVVERTDMKDSKARLSVSESEQDAESKRRAARMPARVVDLTRALHYEAKAGRWAGE